MSKKQNLLKWLLNLTKSIIKWLFGLFKKEEIKKDNLNFHEKLEIFTQGLEKAETGYYSSIDSEKIGGFVLPNGIIIKLYNGVYKEGLFGITAEGDTVAQKDLFSNLQEDEVFNLLNKLKMKPLVAEKDKNERFFDQFLNHPFTKFKKSLVEDNPFFKEFSIGDNETIIVYPCHFELIDGIKQGAFRCLYNGDKTSWVCDGDFLTEDDVISLLRKYIK